VYGFSTLDNILEDTKANSPPMPSSPTLPASSFAPNSPPLDTIPPPSELFNDDFDAPNSSDRFSLFSPSVETPWAETDPVAAILRGENPSLFPSSDKTAIKGTVDQGIASSPASTSKFRDPDPLSDLLEASIRDTEKALAGEDDSDEEEEETKGEFRLEADSSLLTENWADLAGVGVSDVGLPPAGLDATESEEALQFLFFFCFLAFWFIFKYFRLFEDFFHSLSLADATPNSGSNAGSNADNPRVGQKRRRPE
jgi:hypothetical protein